MNSRAVWLRITSRNPTGRAVFLDTIAHQALNSLFGGGLVKKLLKPPFGITGCLDIFITTSEINDTVRRAI